MRPDLQRHTPYAALIGTEVLRVDPDGRSIEVAYRAQPELANRIGSVPGGILAAMLDSLTGLAALAVLPEGVMVAHTALEVAYRRPARPGRLLGRGLVLEQGERDIRSSGELADAEGVVVARATARLRVLRQRA